MGTTKLKKKLKDISKYAVPGKTLVRYGGSWYVPTADDNELTATSIIFDVFNF